MNNNSSCPLSAKGCLVTDMAMYYLSWNPGQTNSFLNTSCGYSGCSLIWDAPLPGGLTYYGKYSVTSSNYLSQISSHMNSGRKVVLEFVKPNGSTHWVLIFTITGNPAYASSYKVYDPGINPYQTRTLASSQYVGWQPNRIAVHTIGSASCLDSYEPNNTFSQAYIVSPGSTYNAVVCSSSDVDCYKFSTTSSQPKLKVTLQNLPTNYQLELWKLNSNGTITLIGVSTNGCRSNETIIKNTYTTAGTYIAKIYGINSYAYHSRLKYAFKASISSTSFSFENEDEIEVRSDYSADEIAEIITIDDPTQMVISPNPIGPGEDITLTIKSVATENAWIDVYSSLGVYLYGNSIGLIPGINYHDITSVKLTPGLCIVRLTTDSGVILTQKVVVVE